MPTLVERLQSDLDRLTAPCVQRLGLVVVEADANEVVLTMPVTPDVVHGGGVLCGQAMLAAADTAMLAGMLAGLDAFRPMTTVQLQTSFLRPVPADAGEVRVACRILRRGRSLAFGEVEFTTADGKLAAHTTTTYALL